MHGIQLAIDAFCDSPNLKSFRQFPALVKTVHRLAFVCCLGAIAFQQRCLAHEPGKGLIFAPQNVLEGIPLASTPFAGADQPKEMDLSEKMPPPGQQGKQNSCVAWSVAYALKSYQELIEEKVPLKSGGSVNLNAVFSPAFIYNQINHGLDNGSMFVDALNILSQKGAVKWAEMPYNAQDFTTQPNTAQFEKAKKYRIDIWRRVNIRDIKEVKAQLQMTYPVVVGVEVYPNFVQHHGGVYKTPAGASTGGHAMIVVGYDDSKSAFKLLNSWGDGWGDGGFGWIDYNCFTQIAREGYVAMDASNGNGPLVRDVIPKDPDKPLPTPPVQPNPNNPTPVATDAKMAVEITNIQHNIPHPQFGFCMQVSGTLLIPPGHPGVAQVVVPLFLPADIQGTTVGAAVGATVPMFMTVHGQAATSPGVIPIGNAGIMTTWQAMLPYGAANLAAGFQLGQPPITHKLLIKAMLYLNNFGVGEGAPAKITITK